MTAYAGDETNFPATIEVLDDGDVPKAASIAPALEGLADRTAYLEENKPGGVRAVYYDSAALPRSVDSTTSTTYVAVNSNGGTLSFADMVAGDLIVVHANFMHASATNLFESSVTIEIDRTDGGGSYNGGISYAANNASTTRSQAGLVGHFTVPADGDYDVALKHKTSNASHASRVEAMQIFGLVYRL